MNSLYGFSLFLGSSGPAIANHFWQSTLFAGVAAALTLLLRNNQARVRYWLWFAASLKFLLPFSLLVALGTHLRWSSPTPAAQAGFSYVIEEMSQPFTPASLPQSPVPVHSNVYAVAARVLPACLLLVWLAGSVSILLLWSLRWRRMISAVRGAVSVESGREVDLLRRLERMSGINRATRLVVSNASLEPGIVGVFHPVMFLPTGIPDRLTDSELSAIIAHELCHVLRRDNLLAAIHMVVEAVFWFHPIVFWIGARMVAERERACDEEVMALGSEPQAYAEGILKVCEFYLEAPLACVSGVTGSNLKKRIEAIMIHRISRKLEKGKKFFLAAVAAATILVPVTFGLLHPGQSRAESPAQSTTSTTSGFESVSIQPNTNGKPMPPFNIVAGTDGNFVGFRFSDAGFLATHATLPQIVRMAYGVLDFQVTGGPDWLNREKYDVDARFLNGLDDAKFWTLPQGEQTRRMDQRRLQLQSLLAERFKLVIHRETRQLPVYSLTIAVNGPTLHEASPGDAYPNGVKRRDGVPMGAGLWVPRQGVLLGQGVSTGMLAAHLAQQFGRAIVDNTGLAGKYDFKLEFATGKDKSAALLSAIPEQLGLQLTPQTGPVEMIVIDRAEPVQNVAGTASLLKPASAQVSSQAASQSGPAFESVSITPKGTAAPHVILRTRISQHNGNAEFENQSLKGLLRIAFGVDGSQISGGPDWVGSNLYDLTVTAGRQLHGSEFSQEFQQLLIERFKLAFHRELRPLPVYELVVASGGSKLVESAPGNQLGSHFNVDNGKMAASGVRVKQLVDFLQSHIGRPVVDKTGLDGAYDFAMTADNWQGTRKLVKGSDPGIDALIHVMSEKLGLELKPATDPVEVLVIDHAEPVTNEEKDLAQIH